MRVSRFSSFLTREQDALSIEEVVGLTGRNKRLLDPDPLVQTTISTILRLQSSLKSVVTRQLFRIVCLGQTVILEDETDNLSENLLSSFLLFIVVIVVT